MLTFQQAIDLMDKSQQPSILLGNGFSQSWDANIFNYANLLDAANFGERENVLRPLFNRLATYDFEAVMKQLVSTEVVLEVYGANSDILAQLRADKEVLKNALITAISNTHPSLPRNITNEQYILARKFLSRFREIFTLNYDLLLYWARNKKDLEPRDYETDDGFRSPLSWEGYGTDQGVHFLHGGLHIYEDSTTIKKHAYTEDRVTIIQQVKENLDNGRFPLFVSEPTYQKKKHRIEHNPYLNYCYQSLRELNGTLFVYGHSLDETDKHIFDQVKSSHITKVFVSVFGDENSEANARTKANALTYMSGLSVEFFQAESTEIWR